VDLEVVGIARDDEVLDGGYLIDLSTYEDVVGGGSDSSVSVVYDQDVDRDAVRDRVEQVATAYPGTDVQDRNELLLTVQERVNGLLNIMIGLLGLALVIAVIGIVNTLALSVLERTREIGLLRAVGMVRGQVRSIVYREAMLVAVFGALLGVVLGAFFGWALVTALADEGIDVLVFPVGRLAVYVALSALAGVGAALLPARRAARLDVLEAIFDE
jgi:putative ABC transport system permease protein